jgi:DNA-binding phage protein
MGTTPGPPSLFWQDLAGSVEDPEALREYIFESLRISTIDRLVNLLDEAREGEHLSKAALARAINSNPAVVRRLLSNGAPNPTIGTLVDVATALGLRVTVEPLPAAERRELIKSLYGAGVTPNSSRIQAAIPKARRTRERAVV